MKLDTINTLLCPIVVTARELALIGFVPDERGEYPEASLREIRDAVLAAHSRLLKEAEFERSIPR